MSQRTIEEYLEAIYTLEERAEKPVKTSSLAQILEVSPASVSEMLHRLSEKGLVEYTPYGGVHLVKEGRRRVLELTRRHRLWEVFLNTHLGISWEDVYPEACNLEHTTSHLVSQKLAQFLGNPRVCPHGSPIPDADLGQPQKTDRPLSQMEVGKEARVVRVVREGDTRLLHHLSSLGLIPGARFKVLEKAPFDGTLTIDVNNSIRAIGGEASSFIMVEPV